MKYIIACDQKKTWMQNGITFSYGIVSETREEGNRRWKTIKDSPYFEQLTAHTAEDVKAYTLTFYAKNQNSAPVFVTTEGNEDMRRLVQQAYGFSFMDYHTIVLPNIPFKRMQFESIENIDPSGYEVEWSGDDNFEYEKIEVVREKTLGLKFYRTEKFVQYDECLTNREDVCEIRLHPYCSDFNLVKDIELDYYDYDM
jgi:hypothetical protein